MCRLCRGGGGYGYGFGGGYGYGFGGGYGGFGGGYGGGVNRSNWAEKSGAAIRRENEAKKAFTDKLAELANDESKLTEFAAYPKQSLLIRGLLLPTCHLTAPCWKTFKAVVLSKGCSVRRRTATPTERQTLRISKKSKVYYMDVTFTLAALKLWRQTYLGIASVSSSSSSSSSSSNVSFPGVEEITHVSLDDILKKRAEENGVIDLTGGSPESVVTKELVDSPSSGKDVVSSFPKRRSKGPAVMLGGGVASTSTNVFSGVLASGASSSSSNSSSSSSSSSNTNAATSRKRPTTTTATAAAAAKCQNPAGARKSCNGPNGGKSGMCKHCSPTIPPSGVTAVVSKKRAAPSKKRSAPSSTSSSSSSSSNKRARIAVPKRSSRRGVTLVNGTKVRAKWNGKFYQGKIEKNYQGENYYDIFFDSDSSVAKIKHALVEAL